MLDLCWQEAGTMHAGVDLQPHLQRPRSERRQFNHPDLFIVMHYKPQRLLGGSANLLLAEGALQHEDRALDPAERRASASARNATASPSATPFKA